MNQSVVKARSLGGTLRLKGMIKHWFETVGKYVAE